MAKENFKYKAKVDGKDVSLELTEKEVEAALSVCEAVATDSVLVMKKHNGGAAFYTVESNAVNAQERHGYEYMFKIPQEELANYAKTKSA